MTPVTDADRNERRLRLLIADPDPVYRQKLRVALEEIGYKVVRMVIDGIAAVEAARRLRPDVVIAEIGLPCLSGIHLTQILKAEHIAPVLVLTSVEDPLQVRLAAEAGVQSYLVKPIPPDALQPAIEIARRQWQAQRARERRVQWMQNKETEREAIDRAKRMLMEDRRLSEADAYRFIQMRSMRSRRSMGEVAEAILVSRNVIRINLQS
jgi:two-component system, response regulator PdtaR